MTNRAEFVEKINAWELGVASSTATFGYFSGRKFIVNTNNVYSKEEWTFDEMVVETLDLMSKNIKLFLDDQTNCQIGVNFSEKILKIIRVLQQKDAKTEFAIWGLGSFQFSCILTVRVVRNLMFDRVAAINTLQEAAENIPNTLKKIEAQRKAEHGREAIEAELRGKVKK